LIGQFFQVDAIFDADETTAMINEFDAEKELFLWSVVTGRHELALLFWSRGRNKVCKYELCDR
jgi:hypothetical protein